VARPPEVGSSGPVGAKDIPGAVKCQITENTVLPCLDPRNLPHCPNIFLYRELIHIGFALSGNRKPVFPAEALPRPRESQEISVSKALRFLASAALALALLSISTLAQQASPAADTFVSSTAPTTNYGASTIEVVALGSSSYLKFSLAGVPTGSTVSKATLRLYMDAVLTGGKFDVYNLASTPTWAENTMTFNTPRPAKGTSASGGHPVTVTAASVNTFILIDITATVQGWFAEPSTNNGILVALVGNTGSFSFDSKESTLTSHEPELEIALSGAVGPQGPQGTQGPQGLTGATGAQGPTGPMGLPGVDGQQGPAGINGTSFIFRNAFDAEATYAVNDVVTYAGSTYVAIMKNQGGKTPDKNPSAWVLMAQAGATGATGATGPAGTTGAQGPVGPIGPQGTQGPQGAQGPAGAGAMPGHVALLQWWNSLTYSVGSGPSGVAFDGTNIWVANFNSNSVTKMLAGTGEILGTFSVGSGPVGVAFNGVNIWVTNFNSNNVTKLLPSTGATVGTFSVGTGPSGVAFDGGANIWVANFNGNSVTKMFQDGGTVGTFPVGANPFGVAFDGTNIWVSNFAGNSVTKLLASTGATLGTFTVGAGPYGVAFDGVNIWVANFSGNSVTKLLASTGAALGTFAVAGGPYGVAFDGTNIWVTNANSNSVTKLLASTGATLGTVSFGPSPRGAAFDGSNIWVTNNDSVSKIPAF
jgi:hypothetical protein